ncbi:MAG: decarboxylase [Betaproteobacteria bacterium]|nr:decarboxylase [Betaproteobacteria bacterium]
MDASAVANELAALHDRAGLAAPFTSRAPGFTPASGYAAARQLHARRLAAGWRPVGRKIGFTNRSIWPRYGVHQPIWGTVYDRTLTRAADNRATVPLAGYAQPRIEPEICFGLKAPPPRSRNPEALLSAIEWIAHSVEIVQCHHPDWKFTLADCTADNGLHGHLVLGTPVAIGRISGLAAALPWLKVALSCNGEVRDRGVASVVLDSPLMALAHFIEVLANQPDAEPLQAGEIISTGTITDAHPVKPGETWGTDLHGFAVRGMEITFA